ncbi:valine--tRNA ligase [Halobellus salinus]|uniref:Valine--tRNA ligase n=1 Tax=Halobellus salinus TaxID=931585 RepID=A0A830EI36_9EURY|nr:valine--tRNA ligase [Halobellus salinus]GGJ07088.1 valine--tRNA ligase [Halobellus salinus]SMP25675.1 valyl-tRNA synthetase [Halobellus salinus]
MPSGDYDPETVEAKWQDRWVEANRYAYNGDAADPDTAFSIDSPPPTVSGSLHWGHVYGFTLQDFVARFNRMRGEDVYFPFGYDDNGIASERLAEDELGVRHQEYGRREFQEMTREVCDRYEAEFTEKMQRLGISIDWEQTYQTISPEVTRVSQLSFVDLYDQGREYRQRAPAIWCPECETAISQVETEDDEQPSHFHDIAFSIAGREETFTISTTRPELLPACVAVFVHPDDDENQYLVGERAEVPLFGQDVPIIEDDRVDMETGSGIVMCCTFGDQTDIEWYQAHDLDLRIAIDESGTLTEVAGEYEELSADEAGEAIVEDLDETGALLDRWEITHTVNVHERCGTGVEFLVKEQWYVELLDKTDEYLAAGREMDWYPDKMFTRYRNWIEGLQWDWAISRQRSSGIPFPVWYCDACDEVVVADKADLPVDPLVDDPPVGTCPECGHDEFVPEDDVFDTWATSSLTPLINAGWDWDEGAEEFTFENPELYQFDLRPQGHDIISFWLFHTVVKCYEHTGEVPFDSVMINGMVLDENREKMSKSKGNVVDPDEVVSEFPVDAARYWAAGSAVGDDLPYSEKGLRAGEKLLQKLWNASKLVESLTAEAPAPDAVDHHDLTELDRWLLASLDREIERLTGWFESREFSKARDELRGFFWHTFCDDYLEIAKQRIRAGGDGDAAADSAAYTLQLAHRRFLKLFSPTLAHVTEELWHDMHGEESVHTSGWPDPLGIDADFAAGETAMAVVGALRKYKSEDQLPMNEPLDRVDVWGDISGFEADISGVMHVEELNALRTRPEVESVVTGVDLDYSLVGPEFGSQVPDIEAGIEAGEYEVVDGVLHAAGAELNADMFEIEKERQYTGDGEMIESDDAVVIVHREA